MPPHEPVPIHKPNGAKTMSNEARLFVMREALKTLLIIVMWAAAFFALYICMTALLLG